LANIWCKSLLSSAPGRDRSAILNIESILHLEPIAHGGFEEVLKDGSRPRISRTFRAQLEKRLGQSL
jgi:two-component system LytT family response regulator